MPQKNQCWPCDYDLKTNEQFCPVCGKSRDQINAEWKSTLTNIKDDLKSMPKCLHCGKFLKIGNKYHYCPYCGKKY